MGITGDRAHTPTERLGLWVQANLGLPDKITHAQADEAIDHLSKSSVPDALGDIAFAVQGLEPDAS